MLSFHLQYISSTSTTVAVSSTSFYTHLHMQSMASCVWVLDYFCVEFIRQSHHQLNSGSHCCLASVVAATVVDVKVSLCLSYKVVCVSCVSLSFNVTSITRVPHGKFSIDQRTSFAGCQLCLKMVGRELALVPQPYNCNQPQLNGQIQPPKNKIQCVQPKMKYLIGFK